MLSAQGVTVRFGGLDAVQDMDLDIPNRGVFVLVGPNGAGKTTLLNAITRIGPVAAGSIKMDGVELRGVPQHHVIRHGIARSFQKAELFAGLSVLDNVLVGMHAETSTTIDGAVRSPRARSEEAWTRERARELLVQLDLWNVRSSSPTDLPYGSQKLLDVARALVSQPKLLLLDEPFAGTTESDAPRLIDWIVEAGKRCAVLMIEHHLELVMKIADRVTVMHFGRKIAQGTPAAVRADPEVIRCYLGTSRQRTGAAG